MNIEETNLEAHHSQLITAINNHSSTIVIQ
jgi:hypothetical protein